MRHNTPNKQIKQPAVKIRRPRPGSKSEAILTLAATTAATPPEIADRVHTGRSMVHQVLQRYGIEANTVQSFKEHRADILAGKQEIILKSMDEAAIKAMPVGQRIMSMGILYDKERLERGESTSNIASIHADIAALQAVDK